MPDESLASPAQAQLNIQFTPEGVVVATSHGLVTLSISIPAQIMDELAMKWRLQGFDPR